MSELCPTCGQPMPEPSIEASRLLELLRNHQREVYRSQGGNEWFVTYGGGQFSEAAVRRLTESGLIRSKYNDCPNDCFYVGKTIDVARSTQKVKGKRQLVYVGE